MPRNVTVTVPNRSTHDLSHWVRGTARCGTLVPVVCEELMPGTKFSLKSFLDVQMAPCAGMPKLSAAVHLEAFAVPHRILNRGYTKWITGEPIRQLVGSSIVDRYASMPYVSIVVDHTDYDSNIAQDWNRKYFCGQSLADYLGLQIAPVTSTSDFQFDFTPLPFLAYHRVWNDFYRNPKIQKSCFTEGYNSFSSDYYFAGTGDAIEDYSSSPFQVSQKMLEYGQGMFSQAKLADNKTIFDTRQRNFGYDRFTNCTLSSQLGPAQSVSTSGASFSISSLRVANSMQLYLERSSLSGYRWQDYLHAHDGTSLPSGTAQRSIYLGRSIVDVDTVGVQTAAESYQSGQNTRNPFQGIVGNRVGNVFAMSDGSIVDEVQFEEPVYILIMMSLVPRVAYSSGIDSQLTRYIKAGSVTDLADPLLQNTGNEAIYKNELSLLPENASTIFGYNDRYSRWMSSRDRVCGLMRDGYSLSAFALQRSFANHSAINLSSTFLEIPVGYFNQVLAVNSDGEGVDDNFAYWFNFHCNFPVHHPLHESSIPSLQDPAAEHGHKVNVNTYTSL